MTENGSQIGAKIPKTANVDLTKDQIALEKASLERSDKRARSMLFGNIALLTALTATQGFIDPPYFMRGFIWITLALCVVSSVFCGFSIHEVDRRLNELDFTAQKQDQKRINIFDEFSFWSFVGTFVFLVAFIGTNLFESLRTDRTTIDIVASSYQVAPGEVVSLEVANSNGEEFIWAVSSGTLLDANERSVTWIAPEALSEDSEVVEIEVCVRRNHIFFCETDRLIVKSPNQINNTLLHRTSLTTLRDITGVEQIISRSACKSIRQSEIKLHVVQFTNDTTSPRPFPPLIPDLPCCSTKFLKFNCNWNC